MNQTLEISLLSMMIPAIAIAVILVLERRGKDSTPSEVTVVVQPIRVIPPTKIRSKPLPL